MTYWFVLLFAIPLVSGLTCYNGPCDPKSGACAPPSVDLGGTINKCMYYKFQCTVGDTACTDAQIQEGATLCYFTGANDNLCAQIINLPEIYQDAQCCGSDNCNTPSLCPTSSAMKFVPFIRQG